MHPAVDPKTPIRELLDRYPEATPLLKARGLDTCCGGAHPLEEACAAHGVPLAPLLRQIEEAHAISGSARPAAAPTMAPFRPDFLIASLAICLTLGAGSGMFYLWRIAHDGLVPVSHRQIHAYSQILGFAALYVMGIAYHALPRMLGAAPASPRAQRAALWLMVSGVLARNLGQPFAFFAFGRALSFLSGLLAAGAGVLFALFVFPAVARAARGEGRRDPLPLFVASGTLFFLLALGLSVMQGAWIAGNRDAALPLALSEPFYAVSLTGFLLATIYGFASRMLPVFLGTSSSRLPVFTVAALHALGVLGMAAAFWPGLSPLASDNLREAGLGLAALSALVYVFTMGVFRTARAFPSLVGRPAGRQNVKGSPEVAIRIAFGALVLWAVLSLGGLVAGHLTGLPVQYLWWRDAARHVFTIGFLTLLIVGISFRILPVFSGKALWSARMAHWTYGLLVFGTAMRLLQYPAVYDARLYQISSYMGVPVVLALVLFTVNLMKTTRAKAAVASPLALPLRSTLPVRRA